MIPGAKIISGKASVARVNRAGGSEPLSRRFREWSTLRKFLGSKEPPDWLKIDLNAVEIRTVQDCAKARAKLKALARTAPFMNIKKKKVLMKAFFMAQFSYCGLILMFHSRKLNNKINKLHERCLRIVYNDNTLSFQELLETDNFVLVHHRNI